MTRIETYADLLESRPDLAEGVAVAAVGELAGRLGLRLHVVHLASRAGLEALRRLRGGFAELSAETCPQYLYLSDADYARLGPVMKMYPLVRGAADREALVEALKAGEIDTVGSDHAPHTDDEKLHQTLAEAHAGSPGVQTLRSRSFRRRRSPRRACRRSCSAASSWAVPSRRRAGPPRIRPASSASPPKVDSSPERTPTWCWWTRAQRPWLPPSGSARSSASRRSTARSSTTRSGRSTCEALRPPNGRGVSWHRQRLHRPHPTPQTAGRCRPGLPLTGSEIRVRTNLGLQARGGPVTRVDGGVERQHQELAQDVVELLADVGLGRLFA